MSIAAMFSKFTQNIYRFRLNLKILGLFQVSPRPVPRPWLACLVFVAPWPLSPSLSPSTQVLKWKSPRSRSRLSTSRRALPMSPRRTCLSARLSTDSTRLKKNFTKIGNFRVITRDATQKSIYRRRYNLTKDQHFDFELGFGCYPEHS